MHLEIRPALKVAVLMMIGILLGRYLHPPMLIFLAATIIATFVLLVWLLLSWKHRQMVSPAQTMLIAATMLLLGITKIQFDETILSKNHISHYVENSWKKVRVIGIISEEPYRKEERLSFVLRTTALIVPGDSIAADGEVIVTVDQNRFKDEPLKQLRYGDEVSLLGKLSIPVGIRNPGDFDYREYLKLNNIYGAVHIFGYDNVTVRSHNRGSWMHDNIILPVKNYSILVVDSLIGGDEGSFLKGLLVGDRSEISKEIKTSFINAGVIHVLAVSGLNVAFVIIIFFSLFSILPLSQNWKTLLTILALVAYMFITGATPSIVRATIMGIILLGGRMLERKSDIYNSIGVACIVILLVDARQLFDVGFQLSFLAVISMVYFYPMLYRLFQLLPENLKKSTAVDYTAKLFFASLAAQLGTTPLTIVYFGRVSLIALLANVIVIPAINIALAIGFVVVLLSLISLWLASIYAAACQLLLHLTIRFVDIAANLPYAYVAIHQFALLQSILFYAAVLMIFHLGNRGLKQKLVIVVLVVANLILFGIGFSETWGKDGRLTVAFLDVGQGDAALLKFPDGKTMLIDAGPKTRTYDAGERVILPFIKHSGVRKIDVALVTHPHDDHIGGLAYLIKNIQTGEVLESGQRYSSDIKRECDSLIGAKGIAHRIAHAGEQINEFDGARVYVLHPNSRFVSPKGESFDANPNDGSVVLKVVYGKCAVLFMGDVDQPAEWAITEIYGDFLKSDILKVAHHGSITSSTPQFVLKSKPMYAVISVGKFNSFNHPSAEVLRRYKTFDAQIVRTDELGAVMFECDGEKARRIDWR